MTVAMVAKRMEDMATIWMLNRPPAETRPAVVRAAVVEATGESGSVAAAGDMEDGAMPALNPEDPGVPRVVAVEF